MDSASVAFCLVQPALNTIHDIGDFSNSSINVVSTSVDCQYEPNGLPLSKLTQLCDQIVELPCSYEIKPTNLNKCTTEEQGSNVRYVILLSGPSPQLIVTQRALLERYPSEAGVTLKIHCDGNLFEGNEWKPEIQAKIDDIIRDEEVIINLIPTSTQVFSDTEKEQAVVNLSIQGNPGAVERAKQAILRLEQTHHNVHCEELKVDAHLLGIVSGPNSSYIRSIEKETRTRIIVPKSYGNLLETNSIPTPPRSILVLGDQSQVEKATQMLNNSISKANMDLIKRHITLQPRKLDWLPVLKYSELIDTMEVNGTSIIFPGVKSAHPYVIVYGQNEVEVSRTTKTIMQMTSGIFSGWLWLENNIPSSQAIQLPSQEETEQLMNRICVTSGAEVAFRNCCFEVCGEPDQLKTAFRLIGNEYSFQLFQRETKFQVELATEHREFISGKKNGKINKIMKVTNTKIGFENLNECNFFINIYSPECSKTLEGLKLLQEELPAEISFYVPENYHKRIIGVGGKNIQRIMKQFGVYVKFSTAEEFAAQGACIESGDNVVARTPAKNINNLTNFKKTIIDMVESKDQEWVLNSNDYHSSGFVSEPLPMSKSNFTRKDSGFSYSSLSNNDAYEPTMHVSQRLQDLALNESRVRYPSSANLHLAVDSEAFKFLVKKIKHELNIILISSPRDYNDLPSMRNNMVDQGFHTFVMRYETREASLIPRAQQMLQDFLAANHAPLTSVGFGTDDPYRLPGRHIPVSAPGHMRDNRSYSLFDHRSTGSFFEPTVQRRQTEQGITSNLQIHRSARVISESFFEEKNSLKNNVWSSPSYAHDNALPRAHYNGAPRHMSQEGRPYHNDASGWPTRRGLGQGFNPFQTPSNGPTGTDGNPTPKASFYSGYYGF
ncbi:hypothetical protein K7432_005003 [Basidiobolus ranarum]|uniref:K Homology domain-containing protein n=1 Tax=Basidiobolus ranarum TaxID=34480 RepID=A0ABR2W4A5_9FUNG